MGWTDESSRICAWWCEASHSRGRILELSAIGPVSVLLLASSFPFSNTTEAQEADNDPNNTDESALHIDRWVLTHLSSQQNNRHQASSSDILRDSCPKTTLTSSFIDRHSKLLKEEFKLLLRHYDPIYIYYSRGST